MLIIFNKNKNKIKNKKHNLNKINKKNAGQKR